MREWISGAVKKATLELIYKMVDERTTAILEKQERGKQEPLGYIKRLEERQEKYQEETRAELRHINQRLDTLMNMLHTLFVERRKEERG